MRTDRGESAPAMLSAAEMRALEARAIASGRVSGLDLMERAGAAVVEAALACWPETDGGAGGGAAPEPPGYLRTESDGPVALVLCGPGNNGGDGFVVARLLAGRGWRVEVVLLGDPARLPVDAAANWRRWAEIGEVRPYGPEAFGALAGRLTAAPLVVDALFGIGLTRPLSGEVAGPWAVFLAEARARVGAAGWRFVAVDVPSGVSEDDPAGARLAGFEAPDLLTVTFHAPKRAHAAMLARGERVVVKDIGL